MDKQATPEALWPRPGDTVKIRAMGNRAMSHLDGAVGVVVSKTDAKHFRAKIGDMTVHVGLSEVHLPSEISAEVERLNGLVAEQNAAAQRALEEAKRIGEQVNELLALFDEG